LFGIGEDIELFFSNSIKNNIGNLLWWHSTFNHLPSKPYSFLNKRICHFYFCFSRSILQLFGTVACAFHYVGIDISRAYHGNPDFIASLFQFTVECLGERHYSMLADSILVT